MIRTIGLRDPEIRHSNRAPFLVGDPSMRTQAGELLELVLAQVNTFVGTSGGGSYSFQLLCSRSPCHRKDSISASRLTVGSPKHKRIAAEKFVARGWNFERGPICPDCGNVK
jgi:hypothetical protein